MKLEANPGPRLHIAHTSQLQGGQEFAVIEPLLDARRYLFKELLTRRVFKQTYQRLNAGIQTHQLGIRPGFFSRNRPKLSQKRQIAQPQQRATSCRGLEKFSTWVSCQHESVPPLERVKG